eukprot:gnl/MRDRNA2_/MRDRNA2_100224_c0_seq1.p1 gnl/MRDRNA2_/MRDRNA2_100224_c0~~gnl/MRDRNA2_/MRDRNA2_100224_c0_seq1.p1  ORF type:complete len:765 (-),score=147.65 gnl/MRDRNA2_/MRDRNA2_100224_c0_seq1:165-2459(-)
MWSVARIYLLTFVSRTHARKLLANHTDSTQTAINRMVDKFVDKLVDRFLEMRHPCNGNLQVQTKPCRTFARQLVQQRSLVQAASSRLGRSSWRKPAGPCKVDPTHWQVQAGLSNFDDWYEGLQFKGPIIKKNVVVTGGSSGIGAATVRALLDRGHRVFATGLYAGKRFNDLKRFEEDLQANKEVGCPVPDLSLESLPPERESSWSEQWCLDSMSEGSLKASVGDVGNEEDVARQIQEAMTFFDGQLDAVVLNAGCGAGRKNLEDVPIDDIDRVFRTNVRGVFLWSQAALRIMKPQGGGQLVFVSSQAGIRPSALQATYAASKWAVQGMAMSLRAELKGSGVKIGTVNPGTTATRWFSPKDRGGYGGYTEEHIEAFKKRGAYWTSMLAPEDVANAIISLVDQPAACNIETIAMDYSDSGGFSPPSIPTNSDANVGTASDVEAASDLAVLFDFDGTLADSEVRAMEVTFWELAPYLPNATFSGPAALSNEVKENYMRKNAGQSFEFMVEQIDKERAQLFLDSIETVRAAGSEDAGVLAFVNQNRGGLGLPPLEETRAFGKTLPQLQKEEQLLSLSQVGSDANGGVFKTLNFLRDAGLRFAVSTSTEKRRVDICMDRTGLREWFVPEKIHSGESDFDPPCFKPNPDVYLKAAAAEHTDPARCVAVEDSETGVGAAANAGIGLIVGYVGASHIPTEYKNQHALKLLSGARSKDGRGADIVLSELEDLVHVVKYLQDGNGFARPFMVEPALASKMRGQYWNKKQDQGGK